MIHLALSELPAWRAGEEARAYSYVHVGPYLDDMSLAYARAVAGLLPERPTLVVGQPTAVDPSRAPVGKHVLWIQVRMVPGRIRGDAADEILTQDWDEAKELYADRVLGQLEEYAPGLRGSVLGRHVQSPADLEKANPNLVGGDQLGGSMHPAQNFFLRPFAGWSRYRTPIDRLYVCGAGTWPGAGVGAGSGYLLGKLLTRQVDRLRRDQPLRAVLRTGCFWPGKRERA
jgi:phytoene dehydrogenase-like protein